MDGLIFSIPTIHVINLLFNDVIYICYSHVLLLYCIYCQPICSLHIYILGEYLQFVYLGTLGFIGTLKNAKVAPYHNSTNGLKNDVLLQSHSPLVPTIYVIFCSEDAKTLEVARTLRNQSFDLLNSKRKLIKNVLLVTKLAISRHNFVNIKRVKSLKTWNIAYNQ